MDDVLYERCNQSKLIKVIFAENIPFDPLKDDIEWYNNVPVMLRKYSAQLVNKDGRRAVSYRRQMHSVGRFNTSIGIQRFPRDIRSYVCGEYYVDIDIDNCHPVILYSLMRQQGRMPGTFFEKYINNRTNTILEYGLEDKRDTIKIINTEYINRDKYHKDICDFHDLLYSKILPEYRTEHLEEVKAIEKHIRSKKKSENLRGCLMAHLLQKYENEALTCIVQKLKALGYTVGVYAFDGCMVEKDSSIDDSTLRVLEEHLLISTGIPYKLSFKSTETDWVPVVPDTVKDDLDTFELTEDVLHFSKTQARKLYINSLVEPEKATEKKEVNPAIFEIFMDYMNKFVCVFDNPHIFGFRMHTDENYFMRPSSQIKERVGTEIFTKWNDSDLQKNYTKMDFIVTKNPESVPQSIYNLYIPAERLPCSEELFETMCPLTNEYLRTVICSSSTEQRILFDWITKMMNEGKTGIAIVLLGGKGCGKSFMVMFLRAIIGGGDKYYQKYDDINTIKDQFNAQSENNLLSSIEEVVMNGADFHFTQNVLKSKITEKTQTIRKMHTDGYTGTSNSNYIICTNYNNPVLMTTDNRRYFPIEVTTKKQNNTRFFTDLYKEINENIKYIRGFFVDREYNSQMTIPITNLIQRMIDTSISTHDRFVIEELPKLFNGSEQLGQAILYTEYKIFHKNQGDNGKPLPYKYIRDLINLSSDSKYFVQSVPMDDGSKIDLVKLRIT